jgi:hypothetical protein
MHIAPSKQDVESCDRVGLIQAMPAGDSEADVTGRRWEQRLNRAASRKQFPINNAKSLARFSRPHVVTIQRLVITQVKPAMLQVKGARITPGRLSR